LHIIISISKFAFFFKFSTSKILFESEPVCLWQAGERNNFGLSAEGGLLAGGTSSPPAKFYFLRFFFLDLWIKFGKIIKKV